MDPTENHPDAPQSLTLGLTTWLLGLGLISVSLTGAGMLSAQQLTGIALPGCGVTSPCEQLSSSRFGALWGWPWSFIGAAYFAALFAAWLVSGRGRSLPRWLRVVILLGGVASVAFVGLMAREGIYCSYCLLTHVGNLLLCVMTVARGRLPTATALKPLLAAIVMASLVSGGLALARHQLRDAAAAVAEKQFQESLAQILINVDAQSNLDPSKRSGAPFMGRHPSGPKVAPIRIVVFTDYQCSDCQKFDAELERLLADRSDVSVSLKHFPLCQACNPQIRSRFHENACQAARAAETAAILAGEPGFTKMHHWLLSQKGLFTDAELNAALPSLSFTDVTQFMKVMKSPAPLEPVTQDINEGIALGANGTPLVFVNGVELRGLKAREMLPRMLAAVARRSPTPHTADVDRPQPGNDRLVELWRSSSPLNIPATRQPRWTLGPADAKLRVPLAMCHQNEYSRETSAALQAVADKRQDVRIEFWHFPLSKAHNARLAKAAKDSYPNSFPMAQAAEAAGVLGGNDTFWKMHRWLLEHAGDFTPAMAADYAATLGLDRAEFEKTMASEAVSKAIRADIQAGLDAGFTWAPDIYVQNRRVHFSGVPTVELITRVLDEPQR
ncbi:MAG: DsbA family protein [Planctomycetes bacterium]|nr:DsbA family protein [Planctomycetota bacterium]